MILPDDATPKPDEIFGKDRGVCVLNSELVIIRSVGVQSLRAARPLHQSLALSSR